MKVANIPAASNESVAEHAISFYFALRRRTVEFHCLASKGTEWEEKGSLAKMVFGEEGFPASARQEIMGVIGVGDLGEISQIVTSGDFAFTNHRIIHIGNRVATIGRALGMKVQLLDRRGISESSVRAGRVSFEEGIRTSTVLILTCPKTPETTNLISTAELALMPRSAIVINVARGGVTDEEAIVHALKEGKIAGAAADVFLIEPATKENSPLVKASGEDWCKGRTVLSTHVAWCAQTSIDKLRGTVRENIEGWVKGEPVNVVV